MCGFDSCYPCFLKKRLFKNKYKYGHIKLLNKKKLKIININKKNFKRLIKSYTNFNYLEQYTFYKSNKIKKKSLLFNKFFNINKIFFFNKFFNINEGFNLISKSSFLRKFNFRNFFFYLYSFNFKTKLLFLILISNFFYKIFFSNFFYTSNFVYIYLYYFTNSNFLIKNKNFYFYNFIVKNNFNYYNNFLFKTKNRILYKKYNPQFKTEKLTFSLNFLNFLKIFKFKVILKSFKFKLNKILFKHPSLFLLFFSNFHYKNLFTKLVKTRFLEIFKLFKYDWVSINLARLTKSSFKLDYSDIFDFKLFYKNFINKNILALVNSFNLNDFLLENNFFFISTFLNSNKFENLFFSNKYFFWNITNFQNLKISNKSNYFFFFNKLRKFNNFFYNDFFYKKNYNTFSFFNFSNNFSKFNKLETIFFIFFNPFFFKFIYFSNKKNYSSLNKSTKNTLSSLINSFFYSSDSTFAANNLIPDAGFNFFLKKKVLKIFSYSKFSVTTVVWQYNSLLRFLEFCSGRKVCLKFFNFLNNNLSFSEKAQCLIWAQKVKYFRKVLGPRLFLNESLQIMFLSLKLKDPFFLSNWMVSTMYKISFWKYKMFLRYLKYVLRYFFWVIFKDLNIKGIKFQLKGKISVAGNARTRTVFHNVGFTSHTTFNNKILYHLNLVRSFTGVMGLKLWIVF